MIEKIARAQSFLSEMGIDGWLIYDFHGTNDLGCSFLEIPKEMLVTRRFFYWIPSKGEPVKIVHAIEPHVLKSVPGKEVIYNSWKSLHEGLERILKGVKVCAMEYSPENAIPYVSKVDGGTVDLIRKFGAEVVTSSSFLAHFTSVLRESAIESHFEAAKFLDFAVNETFDWIREGVSEYEVQLHILDLMQEKGFYTESPPICAVNENAADPHYEPKKESSKIIKKGDFILIDLWCKKIGEKTVYADITRVACFSEKAPSEVIKVFGIVKDAAQAALKLVQKRFESGEIVRGYEVDDAARNVIQEAGYGKFFLHKTGHNIEYSLHGSGAHMDNLEMHDEREILRGTCFSIEPGIYLPDKFGVRLEFDVLVDLAGKVHQTGGFDQELRCLLSI